MSSEEEGGEAGYDYGAEVDGAASDELIRRSLRDYLVGDLGWDEEDFEDRLAVELDRRIPRGLFDRLETESDWKLEGRRLLDVGAGQGAAVHEALVRGADAWGIEPSTGFGRVACARLRDAGFSPRRIIRSAGERLPFPDESFDHVVSLQVLEHVEDPGRVIREIARVLKPGASCWIACENYLAFREQHYRVAWFPLLPKWIGSAYLRARGRDPEFLRRHVTYITYPQFKALVSATELHDVTRERTLSKTEKPAKIRRSWLRRVTELLRALRVPVRPLARAYLSLRDLFGVGIRAELRKARS